jgi:Spy/CpxP family protein refolding chaperone
MKGNPQTRVIEGHEVRRIRLAALALLGATLAVVGAPAPAGAQDVGDRPAFARADGWHVHGRDGRGEFGMGMYLAQRLDLSDEQRAGIRGLIEQARPRLHQLRDARRANFRTLRDMAADDPVYDEVVERVARDNGRIEAAMIRERSRVRAEVAALLTPEQRTRAAELKAAQRDRMQRRHERRREAGNELL